MTMGHTADDRTEQEKRKLELSAAQVAGSSLATVAAALLASRMGVYGTIMGAGVVSVVATAGGPVIQHFFRRTGDQLRGAARPRARQVPVRDEAPGGTTQLRTLTGRDTDGEFGEATVHGTRVRGWKRTAVASGAAFAIAIGGLGTYEAVAGDSVSSDGRTLLTGGVGTARNHKPDPPGPTPSGGGGSSESPGPRDREGKDGATPGPGTSPDPSRSAGSRSPGAEPSPSGSPDPSEPTPAPSPSRPTPSHTPASEPPPTGPARTEPSTRAPAPEPTP